jgi:hypothetical protein
MRAAAPSAMMISSSERGLHAPASEYRAALARFTRKEKATEELAPLFLAGMESWSGSTSTAHHRDFPSRSGARSMNGSRTSTISTFRS